MKIKYLKRPQRYGDYQASRVIWITTLNDELLVKFSILDKDGNLLYKITEPPESEDFALSDCVLSTEQLEEIKLLLGENDPDFEWNLSDEEEVVFMLGFFGESLARRHWLARDSKKDTGVIVDYIFDSSEKTSKGEFFQIDYFEKGITEDEVIENFLLPKLIEREELDTVMVNIAEAGVVTSYRVTIQGTE